MIWEEGSKIRGLPACVETFDSFVLSKGPVTPL